MRKGLIKQGQKWADQLFTLFRGHDNADPKLTQRQSIAATDDVEAARGYSDNVSELQVEASQPFTVNGDTVSLEELNDVLELHPAEAEYLWENFMKGDQAIFKVDDLLNDEIVVEMFQRRNIDMVVHTLDEKVNYAILDSDKISESKPVQPPEVANKDQQLADAAGKTAIGRPTTSRPVTDLLDTGAFTGQRVLHHGAGRPDSADRVALDEASDQVVHYDPVHGPVERDALGKADFDVVYSGYVLNVLPPGSQRDAALADIVRSMSPEGVGYIAVRAEGNLGKNTANWTEYADGYEVPGKGFQHGFTVDELQEYLGQHFTGVTVRKTKSGDLVATVSGVGSPNRISQRFPISASSNENPIQGDLRIGVDTMKLLGNKRFKRNVDLVTGYSSIKTGRARSADKKADSFVRQAADNLVWLYKQVPLEVANQTRQWYDGANRIANEFADIYQVPNTSIAAVMSALSPQKDWYENVELARKVLDVWTNNRNVVADARMLSTAELVLNPVNLKVYQKVQNLSFDKIDNEYAQAVWLRIYDQTHNPQSYKIVNPDGSMGNVKMTMAGEPAKIRWGSFAEVTKALRMLNTNGDVNQISPLFGQSHKTRNFYNNIIDPNARAGDVTIDTHAVAAALLQPYAGSDVPVSLAFMGPDAIYGAGGSYGLYADAYRLAAQEMGVLPREMQSITWGAIRSLFPDKWKRPANKEAVELIWQGYKKGSYGIDEARQQVYDLAGGLNTPDWVK